MIFVNNSMIPCLNFIFCGYELSFQLLLMPMAEKKLDEASVSDQLLRRGFGLAALGKVDKLHIFVIIW